MNSLLGNMQLIVNNLSILTVKAAITFDDKGSCQKLLPLIDGNIGLDPLKICNVDPYNP